MALVIDGVDQLAGALLIVKSERKALRLLEHIAAKIENHLLFESRRHIAMENCEHILHRDDEQAGEHGESKDGQFTGPENLQEMDNGLQHRRHRLTPEHIIDDQFKWPRRK